MTEFNWDRPQQRPEPDKELMARAHNLLLAHEEPMQRYVRQQWETALAASRVALDAWRRVWPIEASDSLSDEGRELACEAEGALAEAYYRLSRLAEELEGIRHEAEVGHVTSEELAEMEREREEHGGEPT